MTISTYAFLYGLPIIAGLATAAFLISTLIERMRDR